MKNLVFAIFGAFICLWLSCSSSSPSSPSSEMEQTSSVQVSTLTASSFSGSGGVSVDKNGNVYVADFGQALNNADGVNIYKLSREGSVNIFASGLSGASGNAFDSQGNLFQSNIAGNRISKVTPSGVVTTFATQGLTSPVGITIDDADNIYVANCGSNTIQKITPNGVSTLFAESGLLNCPNGLTIDNEGNLYTSNFSNGSVLKINPSGGVSSLAVIPGNNNGHLTFANGRLYVVARCGNRIYEVSLTGEVMLLAGSGGRGNADGTASEATFSIPNGIDASPDGDTLYVNDAVPTSGGCKGGPLNPVVVRMIIGVKSMATNTEAVKQK